MIFSFKKTQQIINEIDNFFEIVEKSIPLLEEGITAFLKKDSDKFNACISSIRTNEKEADNLLKEIEEKLIKYSLIPELRSDMLILLQKIDDVIDSIKEVLIEFRVEIPHIPESLHDDYIKLVQLSVEAATQSIKGSKEFLRNSDESKNYINNTYNLEHQADNLAEEIKFNVFHNYTTLSLPEKFHIRYFTLHVEKISDIAKSITNTLNVMIVKRKL